MGKTGRPVYFAILFMTHNLTFHNFSSSPMNCVHAVDMLTQDTALITVTHNNTA